MTVPPWFGWEVLLAILVLLVAVAVAFFMAAAAGTGADSRSEWQAALEARSSRAQEPGTPPHEPPAEPAGTGQRVRRSNPPSSSPGWHR
jgi:hypothetical protein